MRRPIGDQNAVRLITVWVVNGVFFSWAFLDFGPTADNWKSLLNINPTGDDWKSFLLLPRLRSLPSQTA